jgi:hypothetical protein
LFLSFLLGTSQGGVFAQTNKPQPSPTSSAAAVALLDNAIKTFSRPEGIDVQFHQEILGPTEPVIIEGRVVTAANDHLMADLEFRQVHRAARLKMYCDGNLFHRIEVINDHRAITSYPLKELRDVLDRLAVSETERVVREDVEKEQRGIHGLDGVAALLRDVKERTIFGEPKAGTLDLLQKKGVSVKIIEGGWNKETINAIAPPKVGDNPNQPDPSYLWNDKLYFFEYPRTAKLYLDAASDSLLRLELWGVKEKQGSEKVFSFISFERISPLVKVEPGLFQPTEAELKYPQRKIELEAQVKKHYQDMLRNLKQEGGVGAPVKPGGP